MERQEIKRKKAFTLVELIVVITILGILATIGFIGFKNFLKDARDGNRIMTIKNIENGLKLNYIKSNKYLEPEGEVIHGEINGKKLIKVGEFGKENARQININNVIVDPLTKQYYKYGTDARNKYYEIASVLEGEIAYKSILTKTYASSEYKAKVTGNYPGYIKFNSGSELWIANIPSIILNNTGSVELLGTEAYYVVDKGENLPYKINNEIIQKIQSNELIKKITKSQNAILTGVNITGITETNFEEYFSGTILESFNVNKVDVGNIQILKESVKQIVLGSSTTQYNSCATPPNYTDAIFTIGTPNKQNQEWQSISEETGCYWTCGVGKVLLGNECVSENCSGETPDGTIKVVNATQLLGGIWHYSETDGVCTYKCGENYTENGGNCEPSTRTNQTCTGLIANAVWNSASQITQTWSGSLSEWTPTLTGSYNETTSTTECRYKCSEGFMYDTETSTCKQDIQYSLMFDSAQSQHLSRTPSIAGNRKTWTWSGWVKRGKVGTAYYPFSAGNGTQRTLWGFDDSNQINVIAYPSYSLLFISKDVFRDSSAWYHIILSVDTNQSSQINGVRMWVNNKLVTWSGTPTYTQNFITDVNSTVLHNLGRNADNTAFLDGYLSDVNFIDGQALSPSDFGQIDATTGQRVPKKYTGTYGTNGFYLDFADGALTAGSNVGLGKDSSGNGNYWNTTGITNYVNNQMIDHPTNNFATLNPLQTGSYSTLSKGNLRTTGNTGLNSGVSVATISIPNGKWYFEITQGTIGSEVIGVATKEILNHSHLINAEGIFPPNYGIGARHNGATFGITGELQSVLGFSWSINDIIGVAVDADNGAIYYSKNGNWLNDGNPISGNLKTGAFSKYIPNNTRVIIPFCGSFNGGFSTSNFGQGGQSGLTYYQNAGGYFKYLPPTGFKALSTKNLPEPTIKKPNEHFDVVTRNGNLNTTQTIGGLNFQPDLVWTKSRNGTFNHNLVDSVRGVGKTLRSDATVSEQINDNNGYLSSFNSNGYTFSNGTTGGVLLKDNAYTYVDWLWKAGGTAVTNTSGTITSQVSANPEAGFSIVTSVGNATAGATTGHGLDKIPDFIIRKSRTSSTGHWYVYHKDQGPTKAGILQSTNAFSNSSAWNNTLPTLSVFSVGSAVDENKSGDNYITYLWSEVPGFSKFGSYIGNGSVDGPFIYTGFKPRWLLYKNIDNSTYGDRQIYDTKRDMYNFSCLNLFPNLSSIEYNGCASGIGIDILSNGFKIRTSNLSRNNNGNKFIYAAFAEAPFKYANAR